MRSDHDHYRCRTSPSGRPPRPIPPRRLRWLLVIGLVFGLVIGTLLGLTVGPRTPALGEAQHRRPGPGRRCPRRAGQRPRLPDAVGRPGPRRHVTFAGLGEEDGAVPTPQTRYELGSITKTFTGMLLADAVSRGEMALEDRLAQHLPELAGTPAGDVTLFELATHSSGLPSIPPDIASGSLAPHLGNANPYDVSVERVIEASRTVELKNQGEYAYSNLGMSLLGHAEARAAGVPDWPTLATQRILQPLGMTATTFAVTEADIPDGALAGHQGNGWRAPYWYGPGFTPAGHVDLDHRRGHGPLRRGGAGRDRRRGWPPWSRRPKPAPARSGWPGTPATSTAGRSPGTTAAPAGCTPCWPWTGSVSRPW